MKIKNIKRFREELRTAKTSLQVIMIGAKYLPESDLYPQKDLGFRKEYQDRLNEIREGVTK